MSVESVLVFDRFAAYRTDGNILYDILMRVQTHVRYSVEDARASRILGQLRADRIVCVQYSGRLGTEPLEGLFYAVIDVLRMSVSPERVLADIGDEDIVRLNHSHGSTQGLFIGLNYGSIRLRFVENIYASHKIQAVARMEICTPVIETDCKSRLLKFSGHESRCRRLSVGACDCYYKFRLFDAHKKVRAELVGKQSRPVVSRFSLKSQKKVCKFSCPKGKVKTNHYYLIIYLSERALIVTS